MEYMWNFGKWPTWFSSSASRPMGLLFLAEGPKFQCKLTCHQRPSVHTCTYIIYIYITFHKILISCCRSHNSVLCLWYIYPWYLPSYMYKTINIYTCLCSNSNVYSITMIRFFPRKVCTHMYIMILPLLHILSNTKLHLNSYVPIRCALIKTIRYSGPFNFKSPPFRCGLTCRSFCNDRVDG